MTKPKVLTLKRIRKLHPCGEQLAKLCVLFPNGVPMTMASVRKLRRHQLDVDWALIRLLNKRDRAKVLGLVPAGNGHNANCPFSCVEVMIYRNTRVREFVYERLGIT